MLSTKVSPVLKKVHPERLDLATDGCTNTVSGYDRTVLIIDDDVHFQIILSEIAVENGFTPIVANDGKSGLSLAKKVKPDAIVLDLGLPDYHGAIVLQALKAHVDTHGIPVQIISVQDKQPQLLDTGAVAYIQKLGSIEPLEQVFQRFESLLPFTLRELLVVDDDLDVQDAIALAMRRKDVKITRALSGSEAYKKIVDNSFDCIVLDWTLGDITGLGLLNQLYANESVNLPPIIIYTARELSREERQKLHKYSHKVVQKGSGSFEKLFDETANFLIKIGATPSPEEPFSEDIRIEPTDNEPLLDKKVLVVDDDDRTRYALCCGFEDSGATVVLAENGQLALDALDQDDSIDLVVMDLAMPVMNGAETTAKIRKYPLYDSVPIIALTAMTTSEDKKKCMSAGANAFLTKPIRGNELTTLAAALTGNKQRSRWFS